jgi:hypothetical protein
MAKLTRAAALDFSIPSLPNSEAPKEMKAYLFSNDGDHLLTTDVKDGKLHLEYGEHDPGKTRLFFGPAIPDEQKKGAKPTLVTMDRIKAYEPVWSYSPSSQRYELMPIPDNLAKLWLLCRCSVKGRVVRPVTINGVTYEKPVCHAKVHICEVDRIIYLIPRLPDLVIDRWRWEILKLIREPIRWPIPIPDPPPDFVFDPRVVDPSPLNLAKMNRTWETQSIGFDASDVMFNPQPDPPRDIREAASASRVNRVALNPQPLPPKAVAERLESAAGMKAFDPQPDPPSAAMRSIPESLANALQSNSRVMIRQALIDNIKWLQPYFCYWDWLKPYWYKCDEIAIVTTNHQGKFEVPIWYPCSGDKPDLYFWVEFSIGGVWQTVYHPSIRCHTYWDYQCGSEVTIRITDPRVPWCDPIPDPVGKQVAIISVGRNVSIKEIQRQSALTGEGLTTSGEPFGASCEPIVWFGDGLIPAGITHFRWSYRRLGSSGSWIALDSTVVRHYAEILADTTLTFKPFLLGPDPALVGQNLFKIRPKDAPMGPGVVSSSWAPEVDSRTNTASGYFLTHLLSGGNAASGAGKYELKLEFFHADGSPVNLTAEGVLLKTPTGNAPFGIGTVPTRQLPTDPAFPFDPQEEHVIRTGGDITAFRMVLHVDNNPCFGSIDSVSVNGVPAGPCGFIEYDPLSPTLAKHQVHIGFTARHPNDFATFGFSISKGSIGVVESTGGPTGPTYGGTYTRSPLSHFTKDIEALTLINAGIPCPDGRAAFSENLAVYAMATDGYGTLTYLNYSPGAVAFALEPV